MSCAAFANVPFGYRGGTGGLIDQSVPWVCSGAPTTSQCLLYKDGAWITIATFLSSRGHFSFVPRSPFSNPAHKFYTVSGNPPLTSEVFDGNKFSEMAPPVPFRFYVSS